MISNINNLTKIANILDQKGKYALSDKIENLIKTSQTNLMPTQPGDYQPTGAPESLNPFIRSMFQDLEDTALFGENRFSPYRSEHGPSGPGIFPTLSPTQFMELSKTEAGRKYLAQMQLSSGLKAQNFMNLSNEGFINFRRFLEMNLAKGVGQERKQEFVNALPGTMAAQVSNLLTKFPVGEWQPRLDELYLAANSAPEYANQIKNMINIAVSQALQDLKFQNIKNYANIIVDPKYKQFAKKYGIK